VVWRDCDSEHSAWRAIVPEAIGAWLALPDTVEAPSAADKTIPCIYRLGSSDVIKMAQASRRQLVFELWSCLLGLAPPIPGCGHRNRNVAGDLTRLSEAHALFKGIERPLAEDDEGANVQERPNVANRIFLALSCPIMVGPRP
jgi:hypothetical protein